MVSLRSLVTGVALASSVLGAATPQQIADGIKAITKRIQNLLAPAQSITALYAPLIDTSKGPFPQVVTGLTNAASTTNALVAQISGSEPIHKRGVPSRITRRGPDADDVFVAFQEYVSAGQDLLEVLIEKAGVATEVPGLSQLVVASLVVYETSVNTLSVTVTDLTQVRASDLTSEADSLRETLDTAIKTYEGLSSE
ncbi:hypothetical protein C7999DRAFT_32675 [Corynascus novoguineensis]|uniref:Uncharacterized protein n=1 Tax=Corynascus novoguineensis TaxID=1126955 RepID=A0AAN7HET1_9PEZI|nr:hypothetical protein C7999DRAFT_32675 [Corynascus novoguineensis]